MRNTYQNRHSTFYIRLKVPKVLLPHVSRPHVIHSLRTKDHRQAYLLSLKASLAFEEWVRDMKNKLGIGDDNRVLVVTLPNGVKVDFDLEKATEKDAYESLMGQIGAQKLAELAPEVKQATPLPSVPDWARKARLVDIFDSYKIAKSKTFSQATQDGYFPRIEKFINFCRVKGIGYMSHPGRLHRLKALSPLHSPSGSARVDRVPAIDLGSEAMLIALHKNARTTPAVRAEIAASDETASALAQRYGITEQTVYKWKKRSVFGDRSHPAHRLQTVLTPAQETVVVHLRRTLLLPLDDLLAVTREFICPHVSRSGLDRCLRRHGAGNLNALKPQEPQPAHKVFKSYEPGYVHMDVKYLPQMQDESSRRYLFVAIDRATRWVFVQLKANKTAASAQAFLRALHKACPIRINRLLTDNGKEFTDRLFASRERDPSGNHEFDRLCQELGIEHRLTRPRTPRTNGMVERFNGRIADVLKTHRFNSREDMEQTLLRYVALYNHQLPQSTLGSKTPMQAMKQWYQEHPDLFHKRPYDRPGPDSYIEEVRKSHASDYREEVTKLQDSPLTVDNYTKTLKGFFDFAISVGKYSFENPFANMHLVKKFFGRPRGLGSRADKPPS